MKILKNNYIKGEEKNNKNYPKKVICEHCLSELEYEESDIKVGQYGCAFVDCPCCNKQSYLRNGEYDLTLTADNIEFPTHFSYTSKENGAVEVCDNSIVKEYIRKAIDFFRGNKEEYAYGGHITGDFYIEVIKYDGDKEYEVTVSKDFYTTSIPFQQEDY